MNPRAAVSRYRVNKFGKTARLCVIFKRRLFDWRGFFREPESNRDARAGQAFARRPSRKKAGVKAGLLQVPVEPGQ
jgi:hypothetical protein